MKKILFSFLAWISLVVTYAQDPISINPNNSEASIKLNWKDNIPRIRIGGTGAGVTNGFQIQGAGDVPKFTVLDNGFIGIGTTSPKQELHILGTSSYLRIDGTSNSGLELYENDNRRWIIDNLVADDRLRFYSNTEGEVLSILQSGKVGIGTSQPGSKLSVVSENQSGTPSHGSLAYFRQASNPDGNDLKPALEISNAGGNGFGLVSIAKSNYFSGKIGIGTSEPSKPLSVVVDGHSETPSHGSLVYFKQASNPDGDDLKPALEINNVGGSGYGLVSIAKNNYFNGKVGIGTSSPSENLEIYNSTTTPGVISLKSDRNDAQHVDVGRISAKQNTTEVVRIGLPRASGTFTGYVTFWTKKDNNATLSEKVRITAEGNMGIGTSNPTQKLSVAGTINADEIILEDVSGADFVFEEDYDLRSLEETEQFIKANKHLPEIPSAAEMAEEGLELKEMNILLLKKVEELTLHLINQNKQIQSQQAEIEALKAKID